MRSGTESVLQPRSSRELKFSSSTWMHQQQQQRLLLWRSLQSSSHVNITAVCRYRPEPPGEPTLSCPEAAASRPGSGLTELRRTPHRTAQPRRTPQRPAQSSDRWVLDGFVLKWCAAAGTDSSLCSVKFCWCQTEVHSDVQDLFLILRTEPEVRFRHKLLEEPVYLSSQCLDLLMKDERVFKSWFWCLFQFPGSLKNLLLVIDRVSWDLL